MNNQQEGGPNFFRDLKTAGNVATGLIHSWASVHRLWFSVWGSLGTRFPPAICLLVGLFIPYGMLLFWGPQARGAEWLVAYFWASVALAFVHRLASRYRRNRGARVMSYCVGVSWFVKLLPFAPPSTAMFLGEFITTVVVGSYVFSKCEPLGTFIGLSGLISGVSMSLIQMRDQRIVEDAEDGALMQEHYGEELRKRMEDQ